MNYDQRLTRMEKAVLYRGRVKYREDWRDSVIGFFLLVAYLTVAGVITYALCWAFTHLSVTLH